MNSSNFVENLYTTILVSGDSVISACKQAYSSIDLANHNGGHPRLGAVDLIPIHPLSADTTLEHCGQAAKGKT